jgi:hypothetical protein
LAPEPELLPLPDGEDGAPVLRFCCSGEPLAEPLAEPLVLPLLVAPLPAGRLALLLSPHAVTKAAKERAMARGRMRFMGRSFQEKPKKEQQTRRLKRLSVPSPPA